MKSKSAPTALTRKKAGGGILDNPIVVGVGAAAIVGVAVWVAVQSPNPASPAIP